MRIRLVSAALSFMIMMLVSPGVQAQQSLETCFAENDKIKTSYQALKSAIPIVFGDSYIPKNCFTFMTNWVAVIYSAKMGTEWDEGLKFSDAVKAFKLYLAHPNHKIDRWQVMDNAFYEVYGHTRILGKTYDWEPQVKDQKAWYATIAFAEIKKLNSNKDERGAMLDRVYQASMGRNASEADRGYWLPRVEHYRLVMNATRAWLYSPGGTNDLSQTVARAITKNTGKAPSEAHIKFAMVNYKATKAIYSEMIK